MPQGDRTGPEGKGPRTGRGLGRCSGSEEPGYKSDKPRQGLRDGKGSGRGFRNGQGKGLGRRRFQEQEE